ncbi:adenylate/guanylate cyclase domain-containing protein [Bradyrhizobium sp.]|uniref:adenylate/guanylate cyclase domain-containing protein n=1 Tax=Bradyrhizobium sp. TaxID=376 RepID=UPI002D1FB0F5|nr:adenylate/guanylate cyclase domain-containing protein [Bradyrhizobium sp.]
MAVTLESLSMLRPTIRKRILGIALGLIFLMAVTSAFSTVMTRNIAHQLDELSSRYVEAYGHLARMNVRSLEQALALRRMVIARMQSPPDDAGFVERQKLYDAKGIEVEKEAQAARDLINAIIDDTSTASDNARLGRIDDRIENVTTDIRRYLAEEYKTLMSQLDAGNFPEARASLARSDAFRDEFTEKVESIRKDMMAQVRSDAEVTMRAQKTAIAISVVLTALASVLGLLFAMFVSIGITRPVRRLLEGTRAVEAGRLDGSIDVTTRDEIGQLTAAFNKMVEQLRHKERLRETFGRYVDPRVVEGLIDRQSSAATDGERRVMTVLFCDMKGFTRLSEGMTPQGLVKVMNHYLSTMSGPIRSHRGIIDKYIGDAIMAYWGPPFTEDSEQARLACLAAVEMADRGAALRTELPELIGVRTVPSDCEVRIGIATGEVLVGSIGSEFMMSYTVMGDAVNLASRLENANKVYGSHSLASEAAIMAAGDAIESREIDRVIVVGQTHPETVFEIIGRAGELTEKQLELLARYAEGLAAYRERRWDDARRAFKAALDAVPGDGPAKEMAERVEHFRANPPPADWDGAWRLDHK